MTLSIFYVPNANYKNSHSVSDLVAAQFLQYNGSYVVDPNLSTAQNTAIYDSNGNLITNANPNGYLIVPANYSINSAIQFADGVKDSMTVQEFGSSGTENIYGFTVGIGAMAAAFLPGGNQDLQRTYNNVTNGTFVSAFTNAASYNLGLISAYAGLPIWASELGGGTLNVLANSWLRSTPLDELGEYGLTTSNSNSYNAGYALGETIPGEQPGQSDPSSFTIQGGTGDPFTSAIISDQSSTQTGINETFGNGTSQNTTFTDNLNGTYTVVTTGYSGTGAVQFTETNNIAATGSVTTTITGTGDVTTVDNAAITIASGTGATTQGNTIQGTGNIITVGNYNNITLAADPNNTSAGVRDVVQPSSNTADVTADSITFEGQSIATTATGGITSGSTDSYGRKYTLNGDTLSITDNSDSLTINGFQNGDFGVIINASYTYAPLANNTGGFQFYFDPGGLNIGFGAHNA